MTQLRNILFLNGWLVGWSNMQDLIVIGHAYLISFVSNCMKTLSSPKTMCVYESPTVKIKWLPCFKNEIDFCHCLTIFC